MKQAGGFTVSLSQRDRKILGQMVRKGEQSARVLVRAWTLQQLHQGQKVRQIAANLGIVPKTVREIGRRYQKEGLPGALYEKPRPGAERRIQPQQGQRIIAMVCSAPPGGCARWTVRLIVEEAIGRKMIPTVGRESIRILLQEHDLKPWREKNVVCGGIR
jgi:transposase